MPKPKGQKKGSKQLCDLLKLSLEASLDHADEAKKAGHLDEFNEAIDDASAAIDELNKWGCTVNGAVSRARKRIASLKRALVRSRRPGRSVKRPG